jgi:hypothetical protein
MPRRKPKKNKLSKEQELQLKDKLDSIVLADEMLSGLSTPDIPPMKPQRIINADSVKTEVEMEARSILESLSKFYNDMEALPEDHYIKHKQKIDALAISTMAFQIRTAQHAITKLIEEIDSGRVERGLFEVLAQLQNQIMQMPKNFSSYMSQMEKNYKDLKSESEEMKKNSEVSFDENGNPIQTPENMEALKVRGTKSLMENLQTLMKSGNIVKEAEIVPLDDDLINPRTKDGGSSDLFGGEEEDFEIDDDIFN